MTATQRRSVSMVLERLEQLEQVDGQWSRREAQRLVSLDRAFHDAVDLEERARELAFGVDVLSGGQRLALRREFEFAVRLAELLLRVPVAGEAQSPTALWDEALARLAWLARYGAVVTALPAAAGERVLARFAAAGFDATSVARRLLEIHERGTTGNEPRSGVQHTLLRFVVRDDVAKTILRLEQHGADGEQQLRQPATAGTSDEEPMPQSRLIISSQRPRNKFGQEKVRSHFVFDERLDTQTRQVAGELTAKHVELLRQLCAGPVDCSEDTARQLRAMRTRIRELDSPAAAWLVKQMVGQSHRWHLAAGHDLVVWESHDDSQE